jgi:hypothetical protein
LNELTISERQLRRALKQKETRYLDLEDDEKVPDAVAKSELTVSGKQRLS